MKFTFGIVTGDDHQYLPKIIKSIQDQNIPEYEILIVGNCNIEAENLKVVPFDESIKKSWITKKKNLITEAAAYDNVVYLHDYICLDKDWYKGQLVAGDAFSVRVDRTLNLDGTRAGDWLLCMWDSQYVKSLVGSSMACLLPYNLTGLSRHMYISAAYFVAKKDVMLKYPFNENLSWGEGDDVEWSKRVRSQHSFNINTHSTVHFLKQKDMPFKEPQGDLLEKLIKINNSMLNKKQNRFVIITPSYNNESWVDYNLASVLNQTYTNYKVLYIDDASTDNTYEKVTTIVGNLPNWTVVRNKENMGASYNYTSQFNNIDIKEDDIVVHLDGDDWLYDDTVLEQLNDFYNEKDCWMTYGGFICWNGVDQPTLPYPQSTPHPDFIHRHKLYRLDAWRASHLRTCKYFLWNKIDKQDFVSRIDQKPYWHASDLSWQYPCLEMCPSDKIGLVDFYTMVYNQSTQNMARTREREHFDNHKYELEIRNKKKYKEGLSGEKLPQVNVFPADYYMEYFDIPKTFSYCYQQTDGDFDMVLLIDPAILDYLEGKITIDKKVPVVARLLEQSDYFQKRISDAVIQNYEKFDTILTFDKRVLESVPNAKFLPPSLITEFNRLPNPGNHPPLKSPLFDEYELPAEALRIYPKTKMVSGVSSRKAFLPGHIKRLAFIDSIKDRIDLYGRGINEIPSKLEALRDYRFSVAIENVSCDDYYFTEKITECFLTGTVPIYHGCPNIGQFFDERGILYFNTEEELHAILDSLSEEKYNSMLEYVEINFEKCFNFPINNDDLHSQYYKQIILNGTSI